MAKVCHYVPNVPEEKGELVRIVVQEGVKPEEISAVWKELLQDSKISPIDMHPVLWNWSRNNFLPEV